MAAGGGGWVTANGDRASFWADESIWNWPLHSMASALTAIELFPLKCCRNCTSIKKQNKTKYRSQVRQCFARVCSVYVFLTLLCGGACAFCQRPRWPCSGAGTPSASLPAPSCSTPLWRGAWPPCSAWREGSCSTTRPFPGKPLDELVSLTFSNGFEMLWKNQSRVALEEPLLATLCTWLSPTAVQGEVALGIISGISSSLKSHQCNSL